MLAKLVEITQVAGLDYACFGDLIGILIVIQW
jgi:hypothetical protein